MYERIKELRKQGKTPVVKLLPGSFIPRQKLPHGRPRKYPPGHPLAARYVGRRGKGRPYCQARGCTKMLKVNQEIACSEMCHTRIVNDALLKLRMCHITKDELVQLYDGAF